MRGVHVRRRARARWLSFIHSCFRSFVRSFIRSLARGVTTTTTTTGTTGTTTTTGAGAGAGAETSSVTSFGSPRRGDIRAARERCRAARDAYHARGCGDVEEEGTVRAREGSACEGLRRAYEEACPRSWVEHFERGRAEEAKLRAVLGTGAGGEKTT